VGISQAGEEGDGCLTDGRNDSTQCAPGHACLFGACHHWCLDTTDCTDGAVCEPFGTVAGRAVGVCYECEPPAAGGECDVAPYNCGCDAGDACQIGNLTTGATACVAAGQGREGAACTQNTQCAKGLVCIGSSCKSYCQGPAGSTCSNGGNCSQAVRVSDGTPIPGAFFCTTPCDPVVPNSSTDDLGTCNDQARCVPLQAGRFDCYPAAGSVQAGGTCTTFLDCASGLACTDGRCLPWCHRSRNNQDCPSAYPTCFPFSTLVYADVDEEDEIGFCSGG
jgi:hypothetical protein